MFYNLLKSTYFFHEDQIVLIVIKEALLGSPPIVTLDHYDLIWALGPECENHRTNNTLVNNFHRGLISANIV